MSNQPTNTFQIWVVQEQEDGAANHPGSLVMAVSVQNGRLTIISDGGDVTDPACEPIARVIRRRLRPKSGNQLYIS